MRDIAIKKISWNAYDIDGKKVKGKFRMLSVLSDLYEKQAETLPTDLKPSQFQPTFASMSRFLNEGEKGERDEAPLTQEEFVRRPREDITASITKRDEPVNEYFVFGERPVVLTTQTKLARLSLVRFRWNSFGDPILVAESNTIHSVAPNELENDER